MYQLPEQFRCISFLNNLDVSASWTIYYTHHINTHCPVWAHKCTFQILWNVYNVLQTITENERSPVPVYRRTFIFPWSLKSFLQTSHENGQYSAQVHRCHFKFCWVLNDFLHMKIDAPHDKCVYDCPSGLPLLRCLTHITWKQMHPTVLCMLTELAITLQDKRFLTNVTCKQMLHSMNMKLQLQMMLPPKWFLIHNTSKWTIPSMSVQMKIQVTPLVKIFLTNTTWIWKNPNVTVSFLQTTQIHECFLKNNNRIYDTHADVSAAVCVSLTPPYLHYTKKNTQLDAHVH
jgi:hypothetical protein